MPREPGEMAGNIFFAIIPHLNKVSYPAVVVFDARVQLSTGGVYQMQLIIISSITDV